MTQLNPTKIKHDLFFFLRHWYIFVIGCSLFFVIAFLYTKISLPTYNVAISVLLDHDLETSSLSVLEKKTDFTFGKSLYPTRKDYFNQTLILQSYTMLLNTFRKLDFNAPIYEKQITGYHEIYQDRPFNINFRDDQPQPTGIDFHVKIQDKNKIRITADGLSELDTTIVIGSPLSFPWGGFRICGNTDSLDDLTGKEFKFHFLSYDDLINSYQARMECTPVSKGSSLVDIGFKTRLPGKDCLFLNTLVESYTEYKMNKRREHANQILRFILEEKQRWMDNILKSGKELTHIQTEEKAFHVDIQVRENLKTLTRLEKELRQVELRKKQYSNIHDYIRNNLDTIRIVGPSILHEKDHHLETLILELNDLNMEYLAMKQQSRASTPALERLAIKIYNHKLSVIEKTHTLISNCDICKEDTEARMKHLQDDLYPILNAESKLVTSNFQFHLNHKNYSYLQLKEIETRMNKDLITDNQLVIDPAMVIGGGPVWPKPYLIYIIGIAAGFVLAFGWLYVKLLFREQKVLSESDLEQLSPTPVLGKICHSDHPTQTVVTDFPESPISESFRKIREQILMNRRRDKGLITMITSLGPGEGKTFASINMGSCFSLLGKPTLLIGFDLRNPRIYKDLGVSNNKGVSTFLSGKSTLKQIIHKTRYKCFDFIPAGPIPPTPAELINNANLDRLIKEVRKLYKYIIIDTAPLGPVADAFNISRYADVNILTTRFAYTPKEGLKWVSDIIRDNRIRNFYLVLNDFSSSRRGSSFLA